MRRSWALSLFILAVVVTLTATVDARVADGRAAGSIDLRGELEFTGETSDALDRRAGVVYWLPAAGAEITVPERPAIVTTVKKEFLPRVLAVPVGGSVSFPNQDPLLHNVFSVSGANRFDLGLYGQGEAGSVLFDKPGLVRIFCNVHQEMTAYVLVVETSHIATPDREGVFVLEGLPPGPGKLMVWHERAQARTIPLTLPLDTPLQVTLELTKPRVPNHLNKFGKPYKKRRGRRY